MYRGLAVVNVMIASPSTSRTARTVARGVCFTRCAGLFSVRRFWRV